MTDTRDELVTEVIDIYAEPENFPREDASEHAEKILRLIDEAVAHRDAEIREALLSEARVFDGDFDSERQWDSGEPVKLEDDVQLILGAIGLHGDGTGGQG